MMRWQEKLRELFGIDIRSLALFRMGIALILLRDLAIRFQDLVAHYTNDGVLPLEVYQQIKGPGHFSFHALNGSWQFELTLFIFAFIFGIALLIGYRTRLATILSWLLLISLQTRNPMVLQGGDVVLRLLFFWGMFLPLGACWSVDRRLDKTGVLQNQIVSGGTIGLLLQVCFIYWFAALLKTDPSWTTDGTAVWYSLSIEQYATPFGIYLLQFPALLKVLTFSSLYLEKFGPFFAFSPIWTGPLRLATAITFILFHLVGLNLTMVLGPFCYICAAAWLVFIPGWFWDRVLKTKSLPTNIWKASRLSNYLAVFFITYIFILNVLNLEPYRTYNSPQLDFVPQVLRIDQFWNMFSPYPLKDDGWFVIPGRLRDGSNVDLYTKGGPITWEKPPLLSATYPNDRWRSYMMNLYAIPEGQYHLLYFSKYLCRQWNQTHPFEKQVMNFTLIFVGRTNVEGIPQGKHERRLYYHHVCQ